MSSESGESTESAPSPPSALPSDLASRLTALDGTQIRAVVAYAEQLLPEKPPVADLLEEQPGEEILDVTERDGHTEVIKMQPCANGCDECPHGPYLYRVRVQTYPNEKSPSLHWDFLGPVIQS